MCMWVQVPPFANYALNILSTPKVVSLMGSPSKSSLLEELLWSGEWRSLRFEAFKKGTKIHANTKEAMNTESLVSVVHHLE